MRKFENDKDETWKDAQLIAPHALTVAEYVQGDIGGWLSMRTSDLQRLLGLYDVAEQSARRATEFYKDGNNHYEFGMAWSTLGQAAISCKHYEEALSHLEKAFQIWNQNSSSNTTKQGEHIATLYNRMGLALVNQNRFEEAVKKHQEAIKILEQLIALEGEVRALRLARPRLLNGLGYALFRAENYPDAMKCHTEALELRKELYGDDHPDVAQSINDLAIIYMKQGNLRLAEEEHRKALSIRQRRLGKDHVVVTISLSNLADVLEAANQLKEAEEMRREILRILRTKSSDPNSSEITSAETKLGKTLQLQKQQCTKALEGQVDPEEIPKKDQLQK
eukprot:TRINITY_DN10423_c0_g1_i1.p2 TRINITY_DN10423_c0_g1~~TRINITY_DN10423_c0_g1_i1.p2  ORF type:complete len:335 (-),score=67.75 TRINITY_DN10423_c0_g1_i1:96-1100(-)